MVRVGAAVVLVVDTVVVLVEVARASGTHLPLRSTHSPIPYSASQRSRAASSTLSPEPQASTPRTTATRHRQRAAIWDIWLEDGNSLVPIDSGSSAVRGSAARALVSHCVRAGHGCCAIVRTTTPGHLKRAG